MVKKTIFLMLFVLVLENYAKSQDTISSDCYDMMVWSVESTPCFDNDKECVKLSNLIYSNLKQIDTITQPKTIYVEFLVDTLGYTHDHTVLNPTNSVLDDEALRVCRLVKFDHPAKQRNHPVCMKMYFPVKFKPKQPNYRHQD